MFGAFNYDVDDDDDVFLRTTSSESGNHQQQQLSQADIYRIQSIIDGHNNNNGGGDQWAPLPAQQQQQASDEWVQPASGWPRGPQVTKHKEWITDEILHVINFRDSLYKASKRNPNPAIVDLYKKASWNSLSLAVGTSL